MKIGRYDFAAYCLYVAYSAVSIVIPMSLYHIGEDLGFPLASGGLSSGGALQISRAVPMVLAMLACGFVAARIGMRRTLRYASLVMLIGIALAAFSSHYAFLFVALFIGGCGEGLVEGIGTPFVQELHQPEASGYINFTHSFWSVGILLVTLVGGYLLGIGISWRYLVLGCALMALPAFFLFGDSRRQPYPERVGDFSFTVILRQAKDICSCHRFWLFFVTMIFAGGGEFGITFWTASYVQLVFSGTPWFAGIATACFALGMFVGRFFIGIFVPQKFLYQSIVVMGVLGVFISLCMPLLGTSWLDSAVQAHPWLGVFNGKTFFALLLFVAGIASAPFWPSIQSYTTICLPRLDSTMQFVILSCAGVPGCAAATWLMGYVGNVFGMRAALLLVPICYAMMILLLAMDRHVNSTKELRGNREIAN